MRPDEWIMDEMGPRVWITAPGACEKEGRYPIKGAMAMGAIGEREEDDRIRRGIRPGRWYLCIAGTFARRKWISPFDLHEAMARMHRREMDSLDLNANLQGLIRIGREPNENG